MKAIANLNFSGILPSKGVRADFSVLYVRKQREVTKNLV
jgi:hypothetical protein